MASETTSKTRAKIPGFFFLFVLDIIQMLKLSPDFETGGMSTSSKNNPSQQSELDHDSASAR